MSLSKMSKACCFSLGFVFNCFSLMLLVLTISSNYWYVAEKGSAEGNILTNVSIQPLLYPYSLGLWMTCYGKNVPDTVLKKDLVYPNCFWNYDFPSKQLEDFARSSEVSLVLAAGIIAVSGFLVAAGRLCERSTPIQIGGILLIISGLMSFIGICCFIGRVFLREAGRSLNNNSTEYFSWSFYVAWASLFFQEVAGGIFIYIGAILKSSSKLNNFV